MSVRITGDLAKIDAWRKRFGEAAVAKVKRTILENVAEEALELIAEGFSKEQAPNGAPWAPLKQRRGKILQDTGRMRASFHRKTIGGDRVTIGPAVKYAAFHQSGTVRMVARPMVPDGGLPAKWQARLNEAAEDVLKDMFGG